MANTFKKLAIKSIRVLYCDDEIGDFSVNIRCNSYADVNTKLDEFMEQYENEGIVKVLGCQIEQW